MSPFVPKDWQNSPSTSTPLNALALEDLEERVTDYTDESVESAVNVINVRDPDYGALGNGSNDDTAEIQAALNAATIGSVVYIPKADSGQYYKLSDTLTIPDVRGIRIVGESWQTSELRMTVNNKPILKTSGQFQRGIAIEELRLSYSTQQTFASHPLSAAIALYSASNPSATYHSLFRRLYMEKATYGLDNVAAGTDLVVWNCSFEEWQCADIEHSIIDIVPATPAGQPVNYFKRISSLGEVPVTTTGIALRIFGEAVLEAIDIEDWTGQILYWDSGDGTIDGMHIERWTMPSAYGFVVGNGTYRISGINFDLTTPPSTAPSIWNIGPNAYVDIESETLTVTHGAASSLVHHLCESPTSTRLEVAYPRLLSGTLDYFMYPGSANTYGATRGRGGFGEVNSIASAATLTLFDYGEVFTITGTTTITSITASWAERRVTLILTSTAQVSDGSNLVLATNFTGAANRTITLVSNGTNWYEVARSAN